MSESRPKQASTVLVLREQEHKPLVLAVSNRRFGGWSLPGGKVEANESPLGAAIRELREETTLITSRLAFLFRARGTVDPEVEVFVYLARAAEGTPRKVEDGSDVTWMPWPRFTRSHPFGLFYAFHFPDGVGHFKQTEFP